MNFSELGRVIEQLGKDRGIKKEFIVGAIEQAFLVTARKKFGIQGEYEARYNEEDGEVEIYQYKNVVEKVRDGIVEIDFDSAYEILKRKGISKDNVTQKDIEKLIYDLVSSCLIFLIKYIIKFQKLFQKLIKFYKIRLNFGFR